MNPRARGPIEECSRKPLDGFDAGKPKTRPPKRNITINDLMLHASGLCSDFFSTGDADSR